MEMELYPLIMSPSFRHGQETPWGGYALKKQFGKDTPDDITGESLEVSALPGHESCVANGACRGKTLREIFDLWGDRLTGVPGKTFPLLLKLLDARQPLSVQVHPGDDYARLHEGKSGKSEAWYILDADPGAKLVYGVDTRGEDLRSVVKAGKLENCLCWTPVRPGDVFHIPAGTVHALGPGIRCYEIQQSSDVTYRFWDWGRVGKDGRPRELHTARALDVSRPEGLPEAGTGTGNRHTGGTETLLVDDPHFRLYAVDLDGTYALPAGEMAFLTPTTSCSLRWGKNREELLPYRSALIPAGSQPVSVTGNGRILLSLRQPRSMAQTA